MRATGTLVEPLATYALRVEGVLARYVAIHEKVHALSSIFVPVGAEFASYASELGSLANELQDISALVWSFGANHPARTSGEKFTRGLVQYMPALHDAMDLLAQICVRLDEKSNNLRRYSWREYRADQRLYRDAVANYAARGRDLNRVLASSA